MNNTNKLYPGIIHSDALIHNYISPILNLFTPTPNSGTVKIMSNANCVSKFGDNSDEYKNQLKRNLHGHANIRVQRCCTATYNNSTKTYQKWLTPEYYYVTSSVYLKSGCSGIFLSIARDFAEKIATGNGKYTHNKFLLIDKENKFHIIEYKDVAADFVKNSNNKDNNRINPNGSRCYLYNVVEPGIDMNFAEHENAHYFNDVHIGVTRYATHISGTPCKVVFYDKDGNSTQTQTFKSTKEAFDKLSKAFDITFSYKTFIRLVKKNSLQKFILKGSGKEVLACICEQDAEPLVPEMTETVNIPEFDAVITAMKALDIVVSETDIYLAKQNNLTPEEFTEYLLKKEREADIQYNTEFAMPEDSEEHQDINELDELLYSNTNYLEEEMTNED